MLDYVVILVGAGVRKIFAFGINLGIGDKLGLDDPSFGRAEVPGEGGQFRTVSQRQG